MLSAALISGCISVVFNNDIHDFFITCLVGMLGWVIFSVISTRVQASFISEFMAAASIGAMAFLRFILVSVKVPITLSLDP